MANSSQDNKTRGAPRRLTPLLYAWLGYQIETLDPGCFTRVMATGIISNALFLTGPTGLSEVMFVINLIVYPGLLLLTIMRFLWFRRRIWADLIDPTRVFGFFTIVAATDVVGIGLDLRGEAFAAATLWVCAFSLWLFLIYFGFAVLAFLDTTGGANVLQGGWLVAIVATESLVILGGIVVPHVGSLGPAVFVLIHMMWGIGLGFYGVLIVFLSYRIFFFAVTPSDITTPLWIVMGAAAITANAGSTLVLAESDIPYFELMQPFINGITLLMWAWATWWIPFLLLLGVWKHLVWRAPITYAPTLWSLVFPVGMYAVASLRLSLVAHFAPLLSVSRIIAWIALSVWFATAAGLIVATWRSVRQWTRS
jgi:tellurite resistance protein TehA-like permease